MPRVKGRKPRTSTPERNSDPPTPQDNQPQVQSDELTPSSTQKPTPLPARLEREPGVMGGKPTVKGRRLAAEQVLGMMARGQTIEEILAGFPGLERADVLACLEYAFLVVRDNEEPQGFVLL